VVTPVNRAPILQPVPAQFVREGDRLEFTLVASDPDHDPLTYAAVTPPGGALPPGADLNPFNGRFVWTPAPGQAGDYVLHFQAKDPGGLTSTADTTVHVAHVVHAPTLRVTDHSAVIGAPLHFLVRGSDPNAKKTLTFSADHLPPGAKLDPNSGAFDWTAGLGQ